MHTKENFVQSWFENIVFCFIIFFVRNICYFQISHWCMCLVSLCTFHNTQDKRCDILSPSLPKNKKIQNGCLFFLFLFFGNGNKKLLPHFIRICQKSGNYLTETKFSGLIYYWMSILLNTVFHYETLGKYFLWICFTYPFRYHVYTFQLEGASNYFTVI